WIVSALMNIPFGMSYTDRLVWCQVRRNDHIAGIAGIGAAHRNFGTTAYLATLIALQVLATRIDGNAIDATRSARRRQACQRCPPIHDEVQGLIRARQHDREPRAVARDRAGAVRDDADRAESRAVESADPSVHGIEGDQISETELCQGAGQNLIAGDLDIADPGRLSGPGPGHARRDDGLHATIEPARARLDWQTVQCSGRQVEDSDLRQLEKAQPAPFGLE